MPKTTRIAKAGHQSGDLRGDQLFWGISSPDLTAKKMKIHIHINMLT